MLRLEPIDKFRTQSTTSLSGKTTAEVVAVGDMGGICQKAPTSRVTAEKRPDNGNFPGDLLNMNRYSSKKSLAQGMLDIALLTANASQLKYVLQFGPKHEFYTTLIVMIAVSLFLQAVLGILILILSSRNINYKENQKSADVMNDCILALSFSIAALNVVLNTMDLKPIPKTTTNTG